MLYEKAIQNCIFLSGAAVNDSRTVKQFGTWQGADKPFIGWSWFIGEQQGLSTVGHPGSQGGFLTNYVVVPEIRVMFVILCNTPREAYEMKTTTAYVLNEIRNEWP